MTRHILVVEDEAEIGEMVIAFLRKEGYQASLVDNGLDVLPYIEKHHPDMLILDLMLPGKDGLSICKELRQFSDLPVIMVTAKISEAERLIGLDMGADDYICKPFSALELVMRVNVFFRRFGKPEDGDRLILDANRLLVGYCNQSITLSQIEFSLLNLLLSKSGNIFSRSYIMDNIYKDYRVVSDRTVDSHIRNLRKKLKELEPDHDFIESVYGAGYRLVEKS